MWVPFNWSSLSRWSSSFSSRSSASTRFLIAERVATVIKSGAVADNYKYSPCIRCSNCIDSFAVWNWLCRVTGSTPLGGSGSRRRLSLRTNRLIPSVLSKKPFKLNFCFYSLQNLWLKFDQWVRLGYIETRDDTMGQGKWNSCTVVPLLVPVDPADDDPCDRA